MWTLNFWLDLLQSSSSERIRGDIGNIDDYIKWCSEYNGSKHPKNCNCNHYLGGKNIWCSTCQFYVNNNEEHVCSKYSV